MKVVLLAAVMTLVSCSSGGEVLRLQVGQSPTLGQVVNALTASGLQPVEQFRIAENQREEAAADQAASHVYEKNDEPAKQKAVDIYTFQQDSPQRQAAVKRWEAIAKSGPCCDLVEMGLTTVLIVGNTEFKQKVQGALRTLAQ